MTTLSDDEVVTEERLEACGMSVIHQDKNSFIVLPPFEVRRTVREWFGGRPYFSVPIKARMSQVKRVIEALDFDSKLPEDL